MPNMINERIESIQRDIERQKSRLVLYLWAQEFFDGIEFPNGCSSWITEFGSEMIYCEFSPERDSENKDLRSLVHAIAQKLHIEFKKSPNFDNTGIDYKAETLSPLGKTVHIVISGVLPSTCRVEETIVNLTPEEIQEQIDNLPKISYTKKVRRVICD